MITEIYNKGLDNVPDLSSMEKQTIDGDIGILTFYRDKLTTQQAQTKYDVMQQKEDAFWNTCKETYYFQQDDREQ